MPIVKVVILNWNGAHHLRTFLPSVVANTPAGVDIVVADNGSTDGSAEMLRREFPAVAVVELDRNYGFAEGYDRALDCIEADYYVLMNSDVEAAPGWFAPLLDAMEADPQLAAAAPKLLSYTDRGRFEYAGACGGFIDALGYPFCRGRILGTVEEDRGQYDAPRTVFWASGACMMVRAQVFHDLGGFDPWFFAHMEEIDLCWRMQLRGWRIGVAPLSKVYHLGGGTLPNDNPRKIYLNYRNNLAMLYKNLAPGHLGVTLFVRMVLDGLSALVYLLQGRPAFLKAVWRAHADFRRRRPQLREARRGIQAQALARPQGVYRGSVLLRYVLGRKKFGKMM